MKKKLIRLTEQDLKRIIKESVNNILKENAFDYYGRAEDEYLSKEKLPKGWSKIDREDDEPLYSDPDGNEYVKDEYGRFKNINEDIEDGSDLIFYDGNDEDFFDFDGDELEEAGISPYDFCMKPDEEVADFHQSPKGYTVYFKDDEFGEVWYDRLERMYMGNSDHDIFGGYLRRFEGANLNGVFEDIFSKTADVLLNGPDDEDDDEY